MALCLSSWLCYTSFPFLYKKLWQGNMSFVLSNWFVHNYVICNMQAYTKQINNSKVRVHDSRRLIWSTIWSAWSIQMSPSLASNLYMWYFWMKEKWFQFPLYIGHHTWTPSQSRSSVISIFYLKNKNNDYVGIYRQHFTVPRKLATSQVRCTVDASGCFRIQLTTYFVVP